MNSAQQVLDYWFGTDVGQVRELWFKKSDATDAEIRTRFGSIVEAALRGELRSWMQDVHGQLALILLLDQFTRNIYRGTALSFAGDAQALSIAQQLVGAGLDRALQPVQRWFVYMPFEHAESLLMQTESVRLFEQLARDGLAEPLEWARKHYVVIEQFGRFPHRNQILGRQSSAVEAAFLREPGSRF